MLRESIVCRIFERIGSDYMAKIYVAAVTAFDEKQQLNELEQLKLYERNISEGAHGFFVGGSSAELFMLNHKERIAGLEVASQLSQKVDLIAHVGDINTANAIKLAIEAKRLGYDKISATPPLYFNYSIHDLIAYYMEISAAVDLPIIYYNIPMNTHVNIDLTNPLWEQLFTSGIISGVKHTEHNIFLAERLKNLNENLTIFGGLEQNMLGFKGMGVNDFIGSTFNFMLPHYLEINRLYEEGFLQDALSLQKKANNIMEEIWNLGLFPSIKYILNTQGNLVGLTRKPLGGLNVEDKQKIDKVLFDNLWQA